MSLLMQPPLSLFHFIGRELVSKRTAYISATPMCLTRSAFHSQFYFSSAGIVVGRNLQGDLHATDELSGWSGAQPSSRLETQRSRVNPAPVCIVVRYQLADRAYAVLDEAGPNAPRKIEHPPNASVKTMAGQGTASG